MGAQLLGFAPLQPFGAYPWQAYVHPGDGHQPTPGMHRVAAPSTALSSWEPATTQSAVLQPFQLYGGASMHGGEGSSFPGWFHPMM